MHSLRFKTLARHDVVLTVLLGLITVQLLLLSQVLGVGLTKMSTGLLLVGLPLLMLALVYAARYANSRCAHMAIFMVIAGNLGMMLGSMWDSGQPGLLAMTALCSSVPGFDPGMIWTRISTAPWMFAGMLLGCNLGMLLSDWMLQEHRQAGVNVAVLYPVCNVGMLGGMLLVESFMPAQETFATPVAATATMISLMLSGMSLGMLLSWWLAECASRLVQYLRTPLRSVIK